MRARSLPLVYICMIAAAARAEPRPPQASRYEIAAQTHIFPELRPCRQALEGTELPMCRENLQPSHLYQPMLASSAAADETAIEAILASNAVIPAAKMETTARTTEIAAPERGFQWSGALRQSMFLLSLQHTARLAQEKTRDELGGRFFREWSGAVHGLKGWDDGDSFFTSYIGHPMTGAWVGFIAIQNDPAGRRQEIGASRAYWNSRLKALAWDAVYEAQWHIGPLSEASIGHVGKRPGTLGLVDFVTSPVGGFGLIALEDALDRYVARPLEKGRDLRRRRIYRMLLNPNRAFANLIRFEKPWHRDTRRLDWE